MENKITFDWKAESQRFDGVANLYDTYRPGYPSGLIDDIILISGIQTDGRILEIGSGTGKATLFFARKGYTILCLEPGQNLIDVATKNLASFSNVSFVRSRFEEWRDDEEKFDLVISAQAYHWIPEEVRYEKTANVLKHQGYLATFWNMYPDINGKIRQELDKVYHKRAPELSKLETPYKQLLETRANSFRKTPYFKKVVVRKYTWSARYKTDEYLGLLNTYSDHLSLSEQKRGVLFEDIAEVIEKNGGFIERPYLSVLYIAQKKGHKKQAHTKRSVGV